jgi:hypothetical protein
VISRRSSQLSKKRTSFLIEPNTPADSPLKSAVLTDGRTASVQRRHEQCMDRRCWRMVAYPDKAAFLGGLLPDSRSTGTKNLLTERLDEYVGDCVNSTDTRRHRRFSVSIFLIAFLTAPQRSSVARSYDRHALSTRLVLCPFPSGRPQSKRAWWIRYFPEDA